MPTKRLKHIGVDSFFAERKKLLDAYDHAKQQASEDQVKTDHGIAGEALVRDWLRSFLPQRFGVCKGYIITPNLDYEGELEEWDIIIYDAIESPILYTREIKGHHESEKRRAIPVEYVRAVVEVKATLTPAMVKKSTKKLLKLQQFIGVNTSDAYPIYLCHPFVCTAIFFETNVRDLKEYRRALDNFIPVLNSIPTLPFIGALVLRSQRERSHSGYLQAMQSEQQMSWPDVFEMSSEFQCPNGTCGSFGCLSYGVNSYPTYIFDFLAFINGSKTNRASSLYGLDFANPQGSRLFH
jgi:hypothetical protein